MNQQQVIVTVGETGDVKVEANGCVGNGCAALTAEIEKAIGKTTGDVKKSEFHQQAQAGQQAKAGW